MSESLEHRSGRGISHRMQGHLQDSAFIDAMRTAKHRSKNGSATPMDLELLAAWSKLSEPEIDVGFHTRYWPG